LIQEDGISYIAPDEVDDSPEDGSELARARQLLSPAWVFKMKEKMKHSALKRIAAEKEVFPSPSIANFVKTDSIL
jgi:hypothetical protein